ncbi:MAG: hypothetical protein K0S65_3645 [Labilithrix sp.]|jgi:hypothetical protein|nr:hypothetical protein [Labilithrix sp.]
MSRITRAEAAETFGLVIFGLLLIVLAIAAWVLLVGGLVWGIWMVATQGPSFWPIAAIVVCGLAILLDLGRRVRR